MLVRSAQLAIALILALLVAGLVSAATTDKQLALVAYSTPRDAYAKLIPAFQKTPAGQGVSFTQSYGASGDRARALAAGLTGDGVAPSLPPGVDGLLKT